MSTNIAIPTFDFSGFYYAEILEALMQYKRINVPELTDESIYEPFIQMIKATACVGHLNNVLLDLVANENTLPTAKLVETVRNMLALIEYVLSPANPATTDVVYQLSKVFTSSYEVVSAYAQAATQREEGVEPIVFEALTSFTIDRTDQHSYVYAEIANWVRDGDMEESGYGSQLLADGDMEAAGYGSELLADGDMEEAGTGSWTAGNNATLTKETTSPEGGLRNLKVAYSDTADPYAGQTILTVGKTYRVTGYGRGDGTNGVARVYDGTTPLHTGITASTWTLFDIAFIATSTEIRFVNNYSAASYAEFDTVTVKEAINPDWTDLNDSITTKEDTDAQEGNQNIKCEFSVTANPGVYQDVMTIGKPYRVTGYARKSGTCKAALKYGTITVKEIEEDSWTAFDEVDVTDGVRFKLSSSLCNASGEYVEYDDVLLREVINPAWTAVNNALLTKETTPSPHGGSQFLRITYDGTANPGASQDALELDREFRAIGWARGDASAAPSLKNGTTTLWTGTSSSSWQQFDVTFTPTSSTVLELASNADATGEYVDFDDITMYPTDSKFKDFTTEANSTTTPADDWMPFLTPAVGDCVYWGHKNVMWDKLEAFMTTGSALINGVLEYYDGDWRKTTPTSVTDNGDGTITFDLTSFLGIYNRQGTVVRVQLNKTSVYEDASVTFTGGVNKITTADSLGQVVISEKIEDYTVGSEWVIIDPVTIDVGSWDFESSENAYSFTLPQTTTENWIQKEVNDNTAYWLRYRIIAVSSPTLPVFQYTTMDAGNQYVLKNTVQGTYFEDSPRSSDGSSNQVFETSKDNFIWGSEIVRVDGEVWSRVTNFLYSEVGHKHYKVELGENDRASIRTGGGGSGLAPPSGTGNIEISFRYGANNNGNVGSETVIVDRTGLTYVSQLWNPRPALGWAEAQGASEESLELAKIKGPASVKTKTVALGPEDIKELAVAYENDDGVSLFSRAEVCEEGYGPKTNWLILVAAGGGLATAEQLAEIETYFNGDKYTHPPKTKHLVANQEVVATNYQQKVVNVTAIVVGDIAEASIETHLTQLLQPLALKDDGITYEWDFGKIVTKSRLIHEIHELDDTVLKVEISTSDVRLEEDELPIAGTIDVTVYEKIEDIP